MPQANDAELTELFTASTERRTSRTTSPTPSLAAARPSNTFDLRLQAVAGNALGGSGADYTLRADCIDDWPRRTPSPSGSPP